MTNTKFFKLAIFTVLILTISTVAKTEDTKHSVATIEEISDSLGSFHGEIITKWLPDGRKMELQEKLVFIDPRGKKWTAPKGHIIDGASIPKEVWSVVGGPYSGKYRNASIIHDVACDLKKQDWKLVHWVFYEAMLASGVAQQEAKVKYLAVHHLGPRWDASDAEERLSEEEFRLLINSPEKQAKEFNELKADVSMKVASQGYQIGTYLRDELTTDAASIGYKLGVFLHDIPQTADSTIKSMGKYLSSVSMVDMDFAIQLITLKNIMILLGIITLLGVLMIIIQRVWMYSLGLLIILFLISLVL